MLKRKFAAFMTGLLLLLGLGLVSVSTAAPASADVVVRQATFSCNRPDGGPGKILANVTYRFDTDNSRARMQSITLLGGMGPQYNLSPSTKKWNSSVYYQGTRKLTWGGYHSQGFPYNYRHATNTVPNDLIYSGWKVNMTFRIFEVVSPGRTWTCGRTLRLGSNGTFYTS